MKCIVCNGNEIRTKAVTEQLQTGNDVVVVDVKIPVCGTCGERYYDRKTMQRLERIEAKLKKGGSKFREIGRVLALK